MSDWLGRKPAVNLSAGKDARHAGFRRDLRARPYLDMVRHADLPTEHDKITKINTAGKAHFRRENAMPPNMGVVPNLDQIINLGALAYYRIGQCAAIHAGIRPDLDAVLNDDAAKLVDFEVPASAADIAKTVLPDPGTGVDLDTIA